MSILTPAFEYLRISLAASLARARAKDSELGASVVEWVMITVITVVIIVTVGVLLTSALEDKAKAVCTSINSTGTTGTANCS